VTVPFPLRVLSVLLLVWEPLSFALYASGLLTRVVDRGWAALMLLGVRMLATGLGVAAGLALWHDRPGAIPLARLALGAAGVVAVLTVGSGAFPTNRPPSLQGVVLAASLVYYGAWLVYLWRAER
jgi:hypothetical protein